MAAKIWSLSTTQIKSNAKRNCENSKRKIVVQVLKLILASFSFFIIWYSIVQTSNDGLSNCSANAVLVFNCLGS